MMVVDCSAAVAVGTAMSCACAAPAKLSRLTTITPSAGLDDHSTGSSVSDASKPLAEGSVGSNTPTTPSEFVLTTTGLFRRIAGLNALNSAGPASVSL